MQTLLLPSYTKDEKMAQFHQAATTSDGTQSFWKQFVELLVILGREWWPVPGGWLHCRRFCSREKKQANICQLDPETVNKEGEEEEIEEIEEDRIGAELYELRDDVGVSTWFFFMFSSFYRLVLHNSVIHKVPQRATELWVSFFSVKHFVLRAHYLVMHRSLFWKWVKFLGFSLHLLNIWDDFMI